MKFACFALAGGLLLGTALADEEPDISYLPAAVQRTIAEWKGEGDLKKVRTRRGADGSTVYEVDYKERGDEKAMVVAEDGRVISESQDAKGKKKKEEKGEREKRGKREERGRNERNEPAPPARPGSQPGPARPPVSTPGSSIPQAPGETRYIYWDNLPEPVRTAGLAQKEHGAVNPRLIRTQTKPGGVILYHVPYEKGTVSFFPDGTVAVPAAQNGGPMRMTAWDELPSPVRTAALAARTAHGDVNANTVTWQSNAGKSLYHVLYENEVVNAYSPEGRLADPATFWR